MARSIRSATLETRSARLRLPVAKKPVFVKLGPQIGLGYRRNQTAGTWVARVADGKGGNWTKAIGSADDFDDADGSSVLDFWQAQEKARALVREKGGEGGAAEALTLAQAIDRYEADLRCAAATLATSQGPGSSAPGARQETPLAARIARTAGLAGWARRKVGAGHGQPDLHRIEGGAQSRRRS